MASETRTAAEMMREMDEAMTAGPWCAELGITHAQGGYRQGFPIMAKGPELNGRRAIMATRGFANIPRERANAASVAKLRNALPAMTDALAEYEQLVDRIAEYLGAPVTSHRAVLAKLKEELGR